MLTTPEGALFAEQSIYAGGIGKKTFSSIPECQDRGVALTELRLPESTFIFKREDTTIPAKVIPMVAETYSHGLWRPASGTWYFKSGDTNNYESMIHVQMSGDLDIAYQSTEVKIGERDHVVHYGLTGNPHAVSLSRKQLKKVFFEREFSSFTQPVLTYQPPKDVILVQMQFTPKWPHVPTHF
jgi:hypothetical protein